ncbi:pyridoxamine 5'-phosphate oxidase family protein [Halobaculum sp. EA56]|uniref:pyridoxamine 5'-phosphate oxidase family protein n=1 Tax=Halobaculum sp. EA56 TaxID=3421648 RepID=UPI003EBA5B48
MQEYGVEMTDTEVAEFLTRQGHGVLSFGGEEPYGLPISFGYDVVDNRCIFQLVSDADSKKEAALTESNRVNLVAYEWNDIDDWRSVIITGELSPIPDDSIEAVDAASIFAEYASVTSLTVFDESLSELTVVWHELDIAEMTGRQSPTVTKNKLED